MAAKQQTLLRIKHYIATQILQLIFSQINTFFLEEDWKYDHILMSEAQF